jgi:hypothetical protein
MSIRKGMHGNAETAAAAIPCRVAEPSIRHRASRAQRGRSKPVPPMLPQREQTQGQSRIMNVNSFIAWIDE